MKTCTLVDCVVLTVVGAMFLTGKILGEHMILLAIVTGIIWLFARV